jgi:hypothetical protein
MVTGIAGALRVTAAQLTATADRLERGLAPTVDGTRLALLAGPLLSMLGRVEQEAYRLTAFTAERKP